MTSAVERDVVDRLAAGSLLSRLLRSDHQPLRLVAVPRDLIAGDRARGDAMLAGRFQSGTESLDLTQLDFAALGTGQPLAEDLQGFSWLRDLAASASRERGARLTEAIVGRWLVAHGTRIDDAWRPDLWGVRLLYWTAYAPYLLSSRDQGYRSAVLNTFARGARHLDSTADRAPAGLRRITAWAGLVAAGLLLQGGLPRVARGESGLARALAGAQFDDGGLASRSPAEQALLVDRLSLLRAAYAAAKQAMPEALESASAAALAALHGVILGDGALSSWQGGNPGRPERIAALLEGCGLRARPLRAARGWGYQRLSALGTVAVIDAAPPPPAKMLATGAASTLAFELSDGAQRLVINCGGPGLLASPIPDELALALRTTAAHSTLVLDDTNSTSLDAGGGIGRGVGDVRVERHEDNDSTGVSASHDGYARRFGFIHRRRLQLGNDGKELTGHDSLDVRGRRGRSPSRSFAIRFHLAPGVEPTMTADRMGAILRSRGAPPWNFRARGAPLSIEESVAVDGAGGLHSTTQLVLTGDTVLDGAEVGWQLRRSS